MRIKWSVREARADEMPDVRQLFLEYQKWLGVDLCFQGFEDELNGLPGAYKRPTGNLFLAFLNNEPVGCVGVRPIGAGVCEMKRLYVRESARGHGIGRCLARRALREGQKLGYQVLRLDTLEHMNAAMALYEDMGFKRIGAYYENPVKSAVYMEKALA